MPATYGFQPTYDPMPKMAYQAPIAYQPKPQSRPVAQPQPKPLPAPKSETSVASGDREPPAGYRYRVHVPPPDEIGIVLPE